MNLEQFWELIEQTHHASEGVPSVQFELLVQALVAMPVEAIIGYYRIHETLMIRAYTSDLWHAAHLIVGCSDDDFTDFRSWLIAQGQIVYENAQCDPDSLADVIAVETRDYCSWESLAYAVHEAYDLKTGADEGIPVDGFAPELTGKLPLYLTDEVLRAHYPKLWAKFDWENQLHQQPEWEVVLDLSDSEDYDPT